LSLAATTIDDDMTALVGFGYEMFFYDAFYVSTCETVRLRML
jgi:hypothetical protein